MVWILALLCMGMTGLAGLRRGAICAAFTLLGMLAGLLLAQPLAPLAGHLLPVLGFQHPLWKLFVPPAIAFIGVLVIFKIAGNTVHHKVSLHYKYQKDENLFFQWERLYNRLGFCVGVLNGAIYFFILMLPVYVAGYFTTEAADSGSASARFLTHLRAELHDSGLDRVVAAGDPLPPAVYQAADLVDLVLRNPALTMRLAHYPPLIAFCQQKEIQDIVSDAGLREMLQKQPKLSDILEQPKIQAIVTNTAIPAQVTSLLDGNLADLREFLNTGNSPKFDSEKILGIWNIDVRATWDGERKRHPDLKRGQIAALNTNLVPAIAGYSLMATPDNQFFLKRQTTNNAPPATVAQGTWKNAGAGCEVAIPNFKPSPVTVSFAEDGSLEFPKDGSILIFKKEM
jgi:hypothetical protein